MIAEIGDGAGDRRSYLQSLLGAFNSNFDLSASNGVGDEDGVISSTVPSCRISSASAEGVCDCCGTRLEVVGLDPPERARVRSALKKMAIEGGGGWVCSTASPPAKGTGTEGGMEDNRSNGGRKTGGEREEGRAERGVQGAQGGLEQFAEWLKERRREVGPQCTLRNANCLHSFVVCLDCPFLCLSVRLSHVLSVCPCRSVGSSV